MLGYVGPISSAELSAAEREGYNPLDDIGQAGIEQSYDRYLRGSDGTAELTVNSLGQPTSPIAERRCRRPRRAAADDRSPCSVPAERALTSG